MKKLNFIVELEVNTDMEPYEFAELIMNFLTGGGEEDEKIPGILFDGETIEVRELKTDFYEDATNE